jgi:hypothetical protein
MSKVIAAAALLLSFTALTSGCAAPTDDAASAEADSDLTVRAGYKHLRAARDQYVYTGIAVNAGTAYLASNDRSIDVVSLKTMTKTKTFSHIAAEDLSFDEGKLVACGMRDDSPAGWPEPPSGGMANNYVVSFLDPATGSVAKEVVLQLEAYLGKASGDGFVDLPNMSCKVSGGMISVGFSQDKLQHEVVTFKAPTAAKSLFDFRTIPGAERTKVGKPRRNSTIAGFSFSAQNGLTLAAAGYGIERTSTAGVTKSFVAAQPRHDIVDLWDNGGATMLAVDNDGSLLSLDAKTGATLDKTDIPDLLEAVTVSDGYAFVAGRGGIFVKKMP